MDREPEQFKHLGFAGIFKDGFKITFSKEQSIFSKILLAFILPFAILTMIQLELTSYLSLKIYDNHISVNDAWYDEPQHHQFKQKLVAEWIVFLVVNIAYLLIGILVFYLFSISSTTYTVACIYASKANSFKQVLRAATTKVWKRLAITFLWNLFIQIIYDVVASIFLAIALALAKSNHLRILGVILLIILAILFIIGFVYINVIWGMASVVSVLEDSRGLRAMKRSKGLLKGKMKVAIAIFVVFQIVLIGMQVGYSVLASIGGLGVRLGVGIVCFFVLLMMFLLGLVVETVLYIVCKSCHHEYIDQASLADILEGNVGRYDRVEEMGKGVQLEQPTV
ncbi:hypothetical protein Scep_018966 [Stephania cephalantha]|uniref:Uncharacterized protein n=1 Tax=Stephania cephalantha TaxID=152367 RepID=A0AAP0IA66_9MAGN